MKITLKKSQITDLYSADECSDWKNNIMDILKVNILKKDEDDIEISDKYITLLKSKGSTKQKELVASYGVDDLIPKRNVKDFESACNTLGISTNLPTVGELPPSYQQEVIDSYIKQVIADAINFENNNWQPDYTNGNQRKYRPWFDGSSGRWSFGVYGSWRTGSIVGSRLVFENADDAQYFGNLILKLGFSI